METATFSQCSSLKHEWKKKAGLRKEVSGLDGPYITSSERDVYFSGGLIVYPYLMEATDHVVCVQCTATSQRVERLNGGNRVRV